MGGGPRAPDFLLLGAMRAGSTTLHHALASHPDVWMPVAEQFFFDGDDFIEHAESFRDEQGRWRFVDLETSWESAWVEYLGRFAEAPQGALLGEDSTTYLTSELAPPMVARHLPEARLLVILRAPVDRLWSHYWHLVRSGRMMLRLDDALLSQRGTLVRRSAYAPALRRWRARVPVEQLHVVVLEELMARPQEVLDGVCAFLDLPGRIEFSALASADQHRHRARVPRWPSIQRAANWVRRQPLPGQALPVLAYPVRRNRSAPIARLLDGLAGTETHDGTPPMEPQTRRFLEQLLARENRGLGELLGQSPSSWWSWFPE